jgi:hypothetical protein
MNRAELEVLAKFWQDIETNFYCKAAHLADHFMDWVKENGDLSNNDPLSPIIQRMIIAASHHSDEYCSAIDKQRETNNV